MTDNDQGVPAGRGGPMNEDVAEQDCLCAEVAQVAGFRLNDEAIERICAAHAVHVQAARADELEQAVGELRRVFLRLAHTPSPLGDYVQRRMVELSARAAALRAPAADAEED